MPFTPEEIDLLRGGPEGIAKWNELKQGRSEPPNLTKIDLSKANLTGADLFWAKLSEANLSGANLSKAVLSHANLLGANLAGAHLSEANLAGANLSGAHLERANLYMADVSEANLFGANLNGANLNGANLRVVDLNGANLEEANLEMANLGKAVLIQADLSRVNLTEANLTEANLAEANLTKANLAGADLTGANLHSSFFESSGRWVKMRDWLRRRFMWPTVRAFGSLQVLTKASYFMLAFVPILAGVWQVVHVWTGHAQRQTEAAVRHLDDRLDKITPTGEQEAQAVADVRAAAAKAQSLVDNLQPHLPSAWAWAFFAALAAVAGHLVYELSCPALLKAKSQDEHAGAEASSFTHNAPNRDDRLTRALTSLRELAEQVPEQRHPNLVRRHGQVVWIPGELSQFHSTSNQVGDVTTVVPQTTAQAGLMVVAIEEGAKAEYELQGRQQRLAAIFAFVLYAIAAALIGWLVIGQSWAIIRAAWLN